MIRPDMVGYIAGIVNMVHLLPQIVQSYRTKSTKDISFSYTLIHAIGLALWVVYGFMIQSNPVIIMHIIETLFAVYLLVLKIKHG